MDLAGIINARNHVLYASDAAINKNILAFWRKVLSYPMNVDKIIDCEDLLKSLQHKGKK
jgi:hypothetical protein